MIYLVIKISEFTSWYSFWSSWREKRMSFFFPSGPPIGNIVTFLVSGYLCSYGFDNGWPSIFYIFGTCSSLHVKSNEDTNMNLIPSEMLWNNLDQNSSITFFSINPPNMMIFKQQIHVLSYSDPEVSHTSLAYFSMSSSILTANPCRTIWKSSFACVWSGEIWCDVTGNKMKYKFQTHFYWMKH